VSAAVDAGESDQAFMSPDTHLHRLYFAPSSFVKTFFSPRFKEALRSPESENQSVGLPESVGITNHEDLKSNNEWDCLYS
jgi:hypothetical protein